MDNEIKILLNEYVKRAGFRSMRQFCTKLGVSQANLYSNLDGRYAISIGRMFKIANLLGCEIDTVLEWFYPEEYETNRKIFMINVFGEKQYG